MFFAKYIFRLTLTLDVFKCVINANNSLTTRLTLTLDVFK